MRGIQMWIGARTSGATRHVRRIAGAWAAALLLSGGATAHAACERALFNDSHFHLTNYVQQGTDIREYMRIMGEAVCRSTLLGIPLQQTWSYWNSGDYAPTYYLHTDAPLYY